MANVLGRWPGSGIRAPMKRDAILNTPASPALGAPATFDERAVFSMIGSGRGFRRTADALGTDTTTLWCWIKADQARLAAYYDAVEAKAHAMVDEAHEIADKVMSGDLDPRRVDPKLRLIQWTAGKSRAYADKQMVEHSGTISVQVDDAELEARLVALLGAVGRRPSTVDGEVVDAEITTPSRQADETA